MSLASSPKEEQRLALHPINMGQTQGLSRLDLGINVTKPCTGVGTPVASSLPY